MRCVSLQLHPGSIKGKDAMMKEIDEDEGLQALSEEVSWTDLDRAFLDKWIQYSGTDVGFVVSRHEWKSCQPFF